MGCGDILIVALGLLLALAAYCIWFVTTAVRLAEAFDGRQKPGGEAGAGPTVEQTHVHTRPSSHFGQGAA